MAAEVGKVASVAAASVGKFLGVAVASIGKIIGVTMPAGGGEPEEFSADIAAAADAWMLKDSGGGSYSFWASLTNNAYTNYQYSWGFLIKNVTIEQGSTIDSCTVTLTAAGNSSTTWGFPVSFNNTDDAVDPANAAAVVALAKTGSVTWSGASSWTTNTVKTSPELKTIFQTVIDRPGWASGNDIMVIIGISSGSDKAYHNAYVASKMAHIDITYTA